MYADLRMQKHRLGVVVAVVGAEEELYFPPPPEIYCHCGQSKSDSCNGFTVASVRETRQLDACHQSGHRVPNKSMGARYQGTLKTLHEIKGLWLKVCRLGTRSNTHQIS